MTTLTGPVQTEYQDLFSSSATAGGPGGGLNLGAIAVTGDGREFSFTLVGATALVVGQLYQGPVETTTWERISPAAAAIGATSVTITTSITATANILAGGYLFVATSTGVGYTYKIRGNTAVTSAANMVVYLEDPIQIALTTGSTVSLCAHPYSGVVVTTGSAEGSAAPVGVAIYPVTAAQYGWLQITGPANVLTAGTIVVGESVVESTGTAGAVIAATSVSPVVGFAMQGITSTQYGPIFLNI